MNLNMPIDAIPENEFAYLQNVRTYEDGRIDSRPGMANVTNFAPVSNSDYIHSFLTLNDTNPDDTGGTKRFIGYNDSLFISNPTFPAIGTFVDSGFSGNPLSLIGMSPVENPTPFAYVYDSLRQLKFSASYLTFGVPTPYPIGVPQSAVYQALSPVPTLIPGDVTGNGYFWRWQLRHTLTGARSIPGVPTYSPLDLAGQAVTFPDPNLAISGIPAVDAEYTWDLYRFGGTIQAWSLIGSVQNTSGFLITDDFEDIDIASSPNLEVTSDGVLYMPWLVPDTPRGGLTVSTTAATPTNPGVTGGVGSRVSAAGPSFDPDWIPGTSIVINGGAYTIASIISPQTLYINEDLLADLGVVTWRVDGALKSGAPLPYVWGPFGAGQFGLYLFACGDPRSPGTLYWTNGNDPDSVSLANSLEISSSSEPLQNGCLWNGRVWVWSTERMWEIVPDLVNAGQFLAQIVPGARGLPQNWCFAVGDLIYFKSKDGIFSFGGGGLPQNLTDHQLYELLGHDGQNGFGTFLPNPNDFNSPITIQPPDPSQPAQQRLFWGDGVLYFDFLNTDGEADTLVNDTHIMKGWGRDSYNPANIRLPGGIRCHFQEIGFHTFFVSDGSRLYALTGDTDEGSAIDCRVMTGADLLGDIRTDKLIGDAVVGALTNSTVVDCAILGNRNTVNLASGSLSVSGTYLQTLFTINNAQVNQGINSFSPSVGLWLSWSSTERTSVLDWEPSWVPKPERIDKRATDWTDDGLIGAKYLKGVVIESAISLVATGNDLVVDGTNQQLVSSASYTFSAVDIGSVLSILDTSGGFVIGQATIVSLFGASVGIDHPVAPLGSFGGSFSVSGNKSVTIQIDGGITAQVVILAATQQSEYAYFIDPVIAHEMRVVPVDDKTCQIFSVRWLWDVYPEYLNIKEDFYTEQWPSVKYIRGVQLEGDTLGASIQFNIEYDGQSGPAITLIQAGKQLTEIGFAVPFNAKEIRIFPLGNWRRHSVKWIYDNYPPFAALITQWENPQGANGSSYMRGGVLRLESGNANVTIRLVNDEGVTCTVVNVTANGQREFPFACEPPVVGHLFRWEPVDNSVWGYFSTRWDFDAYPEIYFERTPIMNLGTPGAKFIQGFKLTADSGGFPAQVQILGDGGTLLYTTPAVSWTGKQTIPFTFPTPFLAHNLQLKPLNGLRIFLEETEWIWEPAPDAGKRWITQFTSFGLKGYIHQRDAFVAIQGALDDVLLAVTMDDGSTYQYLIPASGADNQGIKKPYIVLQNMKGKMTQYSLTSCSPFRVYVKDCEVRVKEWGSTGGYMSAKPFGDTSYSSGARL